MIDRSFRTVYAFGKEGQDDSRFDFIVFEVALGEETVRTYGQVMHIFKIRFGNNAMSYVLIVRQMAECAPAPGNVKVVREYGMKK